jgi:TP901 family phage tail tape measure protein
MSLASTTEAIKRLKSTLEELRTSLATTVPGSTQFQDLTNQINSATRALNNYTRAQAEFQAKLQAGRAQARNAEPGYIPTPPRPVGGPKQPKDFAGFEQTSAPGGIGQTVQSYDSYARSVEAVKKSLVDMGVSAKATDRILAELDEQIRALPNEAVGMNYIGSGSGKFIAPKSFNLEDVKDPVKVEHLTSFSKQSGKTREELELLRKQAIDTKKAISAVWENANRENLQFNARRDPSLEPVFAQAKKAGFDVEHLQNIRSEGSTGVRLLEFNKIDPSGVVQKYNATISKMGDVLPDVSRKFRTFGQSVLRDVGELTKWSIAMAVIYGPIQKVSEMTQLMIENEVKLATATISVNDQFTTSAKIFNAVADAANNAGEEINTTIDAFTQAYRATGGGASESERFATAQTLLADSMTLAKLAGIGESQAIDTLSAALRQTNTPLNQGATLLDKWVRTTQIANVDMETLATGFAVMGDTAESAGLDIDHLNALVATVAETGLASGKEAANAARRLVTAYQTPGAVEALRQLGIATEDYTGKARGFLDISREIYEMKKKGLISKEDFSNLTLVAGQGQRGQAALSALISNFQRVDQIATASGETKGGESAKAMETQLTTAQTAINRFNNSIQSLAQTMGTKGGVLDMFKNITNGATVLVKAIDAITGSLGKATPMVLAMTAAMVAYYKKPAETRTMYGNAIGDSLAKFSYRMMGGKGEMEDGVSGYTDANSLRASKVGKFVSSGWNNGGRAGAGLGAGIGIATGAVTALGNLAAGDTQKAAADMGGAIVGGIVGGFIGGGPGAMIGSTIGTSMAEVFLSITKPEIDIWKIGNIQKTSPLGNLDSKEGRASELTKLSDKLVAQVGGFTTNFATFFTNKAVDELNNYIMKNDVAGATGLYSKLGVGDKQALAGAGIGAGEIATRAKTGQKIEQLTAGEVAYSLSIDENTKRAFIDLKTASEKAGDTGVSASTSAKESVAKKYGGDIEGITSTIMKDLANQLRLGKIKPTEYTEKTTMAGKADTSLQPIVAALGGNISPDKLRELFDVMTYGAAESTQQITTLAESILSLMDEINSIQGTSGEDVTKKANLETQLGLLKDSLPNLIKDATAKVQIQLKPQAQIYGDVANPYQSKDVGLIANKTKQLQESFYRSSAGGNMSEDSIKTLESSFEKAAFPFMQAGQLMYSVIEGLDPKFLPIAEKMLQAAGLISDASKQKDVGFQKYDVDRATLENLAKQSMSLNSQWKTKFGYTGTVDQQIAIAKNGVAQPLKADFRILALLLEKLVDQGQKQLDGMFNMPEGSSFWVNLAAAKMHTETGKEKGSGLKDPITTGSGSYIGNPVAEPKIPENKNDVVNALLASEQEKADYYKKMATPGKTEWTNNSTDAIEALRAKNIAGGAINASATSGTDFSTILNQFIEALKIPPLNLFPAPVGDKPGEPKASTGGGDIAGILSNLPGMLKESMSSITIPPQKLDNTINQNLNVRMTASTTLTVDGRTLATIVKQYMASDMSKATSTTSTSNTYFAV